MGYFLDTIGFFTEVEHEFVDATDWVTHREAVEELEVSAVGADGHGGVGVVEVVLGTEVELGVVARATDGERGTGASEGEHVGDGGVVSGGAEGNAAEDGVLDFLVGGIPLDDERRTGRDFFGDDEFQRQRRAVEPAGHRVQRHGLNVVGVEGFVRGAHVEGQAEGVPVAVLVEGAAGEDDVLAAALVGGDDGGVVKAVEQGDDVHGGHGEGLAAASVGEGECGALSV